MNRHPIPRRDTIRETLGITVAWTVFLAAMWGAYELSVIL